MPKKKEETPKYVLTYTQDDILKKVIFWIDERLNDNNKTLTLAKTRLEEDFTWHCEQYVEVRFKTEFLIKLFENLKGNCEIVKNPTELVTQLYDYLKRKEEEIIKDIINGKPVGTSTNAVSNLKQSWIQECYREFLQFVQSLIQLLIFRREKISDYKGEKNLATYLDITPYLKTLN